MPLKLPSHILHASNTELLLIQKKPLRYFMIFFKEETAWFAMPKSILSWESQSITGQKLLYSFCPWSKKTCIFWMPQCNQSNQLIKHKEMQSKYMHRHIWVFVWCSKLANFTYRLFGWVTQGDYVANKIIKEKPPLKEWEQICKMDQYLLLGL